MTVEPSRKNNKLIWVYPPNNWRSTYRKTFVYGWSDPRARLFFIIKGNLKPASMARIKIFPNGNFARSIKLPFKQNIIQLIQKLDGRQRVLKRKVYVKRAFRIQPSALREKVLNLKPITSLFNIVIDPGHGGKENGTHTPKGIPEKVFNLQIANSLFNKLRKNNFLKLRRRYSWAKKIKFKTYLTRKSDIFVSLKERINFAKKKKCNLLISIHHNALPDNEDPLKHRGVGIYYTHNFVKPLANSLLLNILKASGLKKYGIFKRGFALTKLDFCYAVLIECGFLTHPQEVEIVTQYKIQERIVRGIIKGIIETISLQKPTILKKNV